MAAEAFYRIAGLIRAGATADEVLNAGEYIHTAGFSICDDLVHGFGGGYLPLFCGRGGQVPVHLGHLYLEKT